VSFGDHPALSTGKKVGCFAYGVFGTIFVLVCLMGAALGDCPRNEDGTGCENQGLVDFLLFPGSLIAVIIGGVFLAWFLMREDR
jgi:hypothetical protein